MTEPRSEAKAEKLSYAATGRQRNVTRFNEKMAFSRRWSPASSSKWRVEKTRRFNRRWLLFADDRALRREKIACSRKERLLIRSQMNDLHVANIPEQTIALIGLSPINSSLKFSDSDPRAASTARPIRF